MSLDFGWQSSTENELAYGFHGSHGSHDDCNLGLTLLVGRSASGKSSLLRIISGQEVPIAGTLSINGKHIYNQKDGEQQSIRPVIMDSKPDCYDDQSTVLERIVRSASISGSLSKDEKSNVMNILAHEFAITLGLTEDQLCGTPSQLTPSGQYLFGLSCACMESSCSSLNSDTIAETHNQK